MLKRDFGIRTKFKNIPIIARKISKINGVEAVYLFGSYAKRKSHKFSDIDICVITRKLSDKLENYIIGFCSNNLDISIYEKLPIAIRYRVFKDGKPLVIKDKQFVNKLKVLAVRDYLGFKDALLRMCREKLRCMT